VKIGKWIDNLRYPLQDYFSENETRYSQPSYDHSLEYEEVLLSLWPEHKENDYETAYFCGLYFPEDNRLYSDFARLIYEGDNRWKLHKKDYDGTECFITYVRIVAYMFIREVPEKMEDKFFNQLRKDGFFDKKADVVAGFDEEDK
jgi:hypothetical protein